MRAGDVAAMELPGGGYGACQVSAVDAGVVTVCALDWHSSEPPTLDQLAQAAPLSLDHHVHEDEPALVGIDRSALPVPPGFHWLGSQPVRDGVPSSARVSAGWRYLPTQVAEQRRWDHEVPAAAKAAYRAGRTRGPVLVDFGGGPVTLGAATRRLDLTDRVPADGAVRWAALDELPRCSVLTWSGPDRGLSDALSARPIVSSLEWRDAPPAVDLAGSALTNLTLHGSAVRTVHLPRTLTVLRLEGTAGPVAVAAAEDGRWLQLVVDTTDPDVAVSGVERIRDVVLQVDGTVRAAPLGALTHLETLTIRWRRPPHTLADAEALRHLGHLRVVELIDAYGLDADTLPDLPALTALVVTGLRRSVVAGLRARYRSTAVRLVLGGARSDTWLAANLTNPFRDWVEDDARGGKAACRAYAEALRALDRLPADGPDRLDQAERTVRGLVERLNELEFVDTVRREEAGAAVLDLARRYGLPVDLADTWFDGTRTF